MPFFHIKKHVAIKSNLNGSLWVRIFELKSNNNLGYECASTLEQYWSDKERLRLNESHNLNITNNILHSFDEFKTYMYDGKRKEIRR